MDLLREYLCQRPAVSGRIVNITWRKSGGPGIGCRTGRIPGGPARREEFLPSLRGGVRRCGRPEMSRPLGCFATARIDRVVEAEPCTRAPRPGPRKPSGAPDHREPSPPNARRHSITSRGRGHAASPHSERVGPASTGMGIGPNAAAPKGSPRLPHGSARVRPADQAPSAHRPGSSGRGP